MIFKIQLQKAWVSPITFIINYRKLNLKILSVDPIPGSLPIDSPDTEITLQLLSEDLSEIFYLGFFSSKEQVSFSLKCK